MSLHGSDRPFTPMSVADLARLYTAKRKTKPDGNREGVYLHEAHAAQADELMDRAAVTFAATQGIAPALTAYILGIGSAYR